MVDIKNLSIIRQSFANTVFTHKVHEMAAERYGRSAFFIKLGNIVIVSLTMLFLVLGAQVDNKIFSYIATGLTIAEIIFLIIQLNFDYDDQASQHKNSALKYMKLRDLYRNLITDVMNSEIAETGIRSRRDDLQDQYQTISDLAPLTNNTDYQNAQRKLNNRVVDGEEFTWSDDEIDRFLPEELRIKQNGK